MRASWDSTAARVAAPRSPRAPRPTPKRRARGSSRSTPSRPRAVCARFLDICRAEDQLEGTAYLARRGIDAATARRAGVTYFPRRAYRRVMRRMLDSFAVETLRRAGLFNRKEHLTFYHHRLLFPFYVGGRPVYLQARTTAAGVEPRWHNMRGHVPALYNADSLGALASGAVVYLVEGFTDTLTLLAHGFAAVGLVGAGGLKEEWLAPLGALPRRRRARPRRRRPPRRRALPRTLPRPRPRARRHRTPLRHQRLLPPPPRRRART